MYFSSFIQLIGLNKVCYRALFTEKSVLAQK